MIEDTTAEVAAGTVYAVVSTAAFGLDWPRILYELAKLSSH
jgi:hypothetical protein